MRTPWAAAALLALGPAAIARCPLGPVTAGASAPARPAVGERLVLGLGDPPAAREADQRIARGRLVFASRSCFYCHRIGDKGGKVGPPLDREGAKKRSRSFLLQHFKSPAAVTRFSVMPPVQLSDADMEALVLYVQSLQPGARVPAIVLPATSAGGRQSSVAEGKRLYQVAACSSCHAVAGRGTLIGPALDSEGRIGRKMEWMLAHFRQPDELVPGTTMAAVEGTDRQLRSLAMYLLSLEARIKPTAALGKRIYAQRNCGYCHGSAGKGTRIGPALARTTGPTRNDVWILEHFRDPAGVTPGTVMPRVWASDWEWRSLLRYLQVLMGGRLGRAIAGGAPRLGRPDLR
jgi:mono/diheme cytochrome c family protein